MFSRIRKVLVLLLAASNVAVAQRYPRAFLSDSDVVAQNALRVLFDGIRLSEKQAEEATLIIKRTWREQWTRPAGGTADDLDRARQLNAARDSALRVLLPSEAERSLFDRNAAALRGGMKRESSGSPVLENRTRAGPRAHSY